jgi:LPS-assembly protein
MKRGASRIRIGALASLAIPALMIASSAEAQVLQDRPVTPPPAGQAGLPEASPDDQISFAADTLDYNDNDDIVVATGDVRMLRAGSRLRADKVVWNRRTGEVRASGSVAVVNPGGDTAYSDDALLSDDIKDGVVDNLLIVTAPARAISRRWIAPPTRPARSKTARAARKNRRGRSQPSGSSTTTIDIVFITRMRA